MKYGLSKASFEQICEVLRRYPQVEQAILYGSRAKGNYRTGSDIDLTLKGMEITLYTLFRILEDIDNLFLPHTIDLSIFEDISDPELLAHIQRVGITFYSKEEAVTEPSYTE